MEKNRNIKAKANDGDDKTRRRSRPAKKRVCEYCQGHIAHVDYKDVDRLKKYIAENGKILRQNQGKPTYTATLVKYCDLICQKPNGQAVLTGITR